MSQLFFSSSCAACAGSLRGLQAWTPPQPGWHTRQHLWADNTRVVGQVTPRAAQEVIDTPVESGGLQEAIQYMKQEVDDAQRIAQMMAVRLIFAWALSAKIHVSHH